MRQRLCFPTNSEKPIRLPQAADRRSRQCVTRHVGFRADPESSYHDKNFEKGKAVILYCVSGGRAALAGKLLKDMGYDDVYSLGGFKDWTGAVEKTLN
jgi:rhodanese-related sulfurtransferase